MRLKISSRQAGAHFLLSVDCQRSRKCSAKSTKQKSEQPGNSPHRSSWKKSSRFTSRRTRTPCRRISWENSCAKKSLRSTKRRPTIGSSRRLLRRMNRWGRSSNRKIWYLVRAKFLASLLQSSKGRLKLKWGMRPTIYPRRYPSWAPPVKDNGMPPPTGSRTRVKSTAHSES